MDLCRIDSTPARHAETAVSRGHSADVKTESLPLRVYSLTQTQSGNTVERWPRTGRKASANLRCIKRVCVRENTPHNSHIVPLKEDEVGIKKSVHETEEVKSGTRNAWGLRLSLDIFSKP